MTRLGDAFVDVRASFDKFDRDVARRFAAADFRDLGNKAGRDFDDGFKKQSAGLLLPVERRVRALGEAVDRTSSQVKEGSRSVNAFGRDGSASFDATRKAAERAGSAVGGVTKKISDASELSASARL